MNNTPITSGGLTPGADLRGLRLRPGPAHPGYHGRPFVVLLTGGALPGQTEAAPGPNDIEVALERAGVAGDLGPLDAMLARKVAGEAFQHGWHQAAQLHRTVAVYVLEDAEDARRFAEFMSREVDPVHVMRAASPLAETLAAAENHHQIEAAEASREVSF
jgi:hypothetical protein